MTLLINVDQKKETGWEGYDLAANCKAGSATESTCVTWTDGKWIASGTIKIGYQGKQLELSVPNTEFPRESGQGFDFKWTDNIGLKSVESLFLEGDVAPDRRFSFRH